MRILVIGSGGREHAMVHAIKRSKLVSRVYSCPGNGGINQDAVPLNVDVEDFRAISAAIEREEIDLVVVGPEVPLVAGITDYLEARGVRVVGPSKKAAQLEGSKAFMKAFISRHNIPTAEFGTFDDAESAKAYIREKGAPIVVKTDGLAAGKGVTVAMTDAEALEAVDQFFGGKFGDAGKRVVIEEYLDGEEASFFALCDGETAVSFGSAQDHKRIGDGDTGPNTGGMGTYSPAPVVTKSISEQVMKTIIEPTLKGMADEGMPYKGFLFAGLMIKDGVAKLLEFNIRFGDPEAQSILPRLDIDIVPLLQAATNNELAGYRVKFADRSALCVVMAAKGYPEDFVKGTEIKGADAAAKLPDTLVFHAATKREGGKLFANGGRVLGVTATGKTIAEAQATAYKAVESIDWPEGYYRTDIGWRAIERLKETG